MERPASRNYWIQFQIQKFLAMPELDRGPRPGHDMDNAQAPQMPRLRLAMVSPPAIKWPDPGYADAYLGSYEVFRGWPATGSFPAA